MTENAPLVVSPDALTTNSAPLNAQQRGPREPGALRSDSTVAWALADVLHEVVGHAGAAVLLGVPFRAVSTTTAYIAADQIHSLGDVRTIDAAATVLNLVTGGLALLALRSRRVRSAASRYFLWLFATISFIVVTLNLVAGADWEEVTTGLEPRGLWRAGVVAAGVLMAVVGYVLPLRLWMPDLRENRKLQLKITAIPVAVLIVVQTLSVARSPSPRSRWARGRTL